MELGSAGMKERVNLHLQKEKILFIKIIKIIFSKLI